MPPTTVRSACCTIAANRRGSSDSDVHSILPLDDGRILVGAANAGIDILDRQRGLVGGYRPQAGATGNLPQDIVTTMAKTPDGSLWAGTNQSGLFRLPPGASRWQPYALSPKRANPEVNGLFVSSKGDLFVAAENGLWHWRGGQDGFETYAADDGSPMKTAVYPLQEDGKGRIWAGTQRGLRVLEPGAKVLQGIVADPKQPDSLSSDTVGGLLYDREGQLWISTEFGLDRLRSWDGKHAQFEHISARAGHMSQNFGDNLLEDKTGRIWSEDHLFDPATAQLIEITKADGMDIGTPWTGSYARTADGLFLFGGTLGVAVIDPEKFHPWENQPALIATELKINGIAQPLGALEAGLTLSPEQRNSPSYPPRSTILRRKRTAIATAYRATTTNGSPPTLRTAAPSMATCGPDDTRYRCAAAVGWAPGVAICCDPGHRLSGVLADRVVPGAGHYHGRLGGVCGYHWRLALLHAKARALQMLVDIRTQELLEKNRKLARPAVTDRLTKLYNRVKLDEQIRRKLPGRALRHQLRAAATGLRFPQVDQRLLRAHQVGDQVLIACAAILSGGNVLRRHRRPPMVIKADIMGWEMLCQVIRELRQLERKIGHDQMMAVKISSRMFTIPR